MRYKDLTGQRFGKLIALKVIKPATHGTGVTWECKCDCGNLHNVISMCLLNPNGTRSCGCGRFLEGDEANFNEVYGQYIHDCNKKGKEFFFSKQQFRDITTQICYYCGEPPSNRRTRKNRKIDYLYNGLDCLDPNENYTLENCVPCCMRCNYMKRKLFLEEFKAHIKNIYEYLNLGNNNAAT